MLNLNTQGVAKQNNRLRKKKKTKNQKGKKRAKSSEEISKKQKTFQFHITHSSLWRRGGLG